MKKQIIIFFCVALCGCTTPGQKAAKSMSLILSNDVFVKNEAVFNVAPEAILGECLDQYFSQEECAILAKFFADAEVKNAVNDIMRSDKSRVQVLSRRIDELGARDVMARFASDDFIKFMIAFLSERYMEKIDAVHEMNEIRLQRNSELLDKIENDE